MSWSGQAHVMNNMYGSSYGVAGANMASSAALGHSGAFFRYMHRPHHPHHTVPGEILQFMGLSYRVGNKPSQSLRLCNNREGGFKTLCKPSHLSL